MRLGFAAFFVAVLGCHGAFAAEGAEAPDPWLGCWTRVYDAAHLAKHPGQKVTAMTLSIVARTPAGDADPGNYLAKVTAKLRNSPDTYASPDGARCSVLGAAKDRLACVMGGIFVGQFEVEPAGKSMKLAMHGDKEHLALVPGVETSAFIVLSPQNPEHALFVLPPAPAAACGRAPAAQP
jgi:hypothetical protein